MSLELIGIRHGFPGSDWRLSIDRFTIEPGQVQGIIGPNGSGKSTLLRIAAGILRPDEGTVRLDARDLSGMKREAVARKLGYLPQETTSEYDFTVRELAAMGRFPHTDRFGTLTARDRSVVLECLSQAGLDRLADRPLSRLSGGERKRAFLASILAQRPGILLLDEPAASLDLHHSVRFFRLLRDLSAHGLGVAVITHDVNFASLFGDRLLFLNEGRTLAWGPPDRALKTDTVRAAYGDSIRMGRHPEIDRPTLLPRLNGKEES